MSTKPHLSGTKSKPRSETKARAKPRKPRGTKRHGAQPDNLNALKHGFYSRHFRGVESDDLDTTAARLDTIDDEIQLVRVAARRVFERFEVALDAETQVVLLDALGSASGKVASLLKTKKFLTGDAHGLDSALEQVLTEVAEELKLSE